MLLFTCLTILGSHCSLEISANESMVIGGWRGLSESTTEIYDWNSGTWSLSIAMPQTRHYLACGKVGLLL